MINKKIFKSLLYAIGLIFFIIYYFNEINKNIDDSCFDELITLKIDSIGVDLIDDFIFHLNEFDDLIEKSFKDYRYEHLLKLSLKNSNKHDLKKISELIKYPDIYYLIKTLNTQIQNQSNNNLIYYVSKINILLKRLVKYFNCEEIDKDIGLIIANDIIINEKYI